MSDVKRESDRAIISLIRALIAAFDARNRRITLAIIAGALTIAAANWLAMVRPAGESILGLGSDSASGAFYAPLYGGLVTGAIAGFSRRPLHADGRAGTYAAFLGMLFLLIWVGFIRVTGELPDGSTGFNRFGPFSGAMFVLIIGSANVLITFPIAFMVTFLSRAIIPNNRNRYGWLVDDDYDPALDYVTPGPTQQKDLTSSSTARSRFQSAPPRYSRIPARFRDSE